MIKAFALLVGTVFNSMAYPYQISSSTFLFTPSAGSPILDGDLYKHLSGGSGVNKHLDMYRSVDAGLTWAEDDAVNRKTVSRLAYGDLAYRDTDSAVWFAYHPGPSFPPVESHLVAFTKSPSNAWGTVITGGPLAEAVGSPSSAVNTNVQLGLVVRSNGDKVVIYSRNYTDGSSNYIGLHFKVYNGSSWSVEKNILVPNVTEAGYGYINYCLLGAVLGGDGSRITVFAWTEDGIAIAVIKSDDTISFYTRLEGVGDDIVNSRKGVFGEVLSAAFISGQFAVLPHAQLMNFEGDSNKYRPGIIKVSDSDTPSIVTVDLIHDTALFESSSNWISVAAAFDASTGALYLVWTDINPSNFQTTLRMACTKGTGWSAVSTLFGPTATDDLIETIEASASGGILRVVIENSAGEGAYDTPHYYQSEVACSSGGCPAEETAEGALYRIK